MSLFSSIQLANNALRAQQIGMQVVGQNIANANTPGYIRARVNFSPAETQQVGDLLLGLGVQVDGVVQQVDQFLQARLRDAVSDRTGAEAQEQTYLQLESIVGELSDTDLSTSLNDFIASVAEVLNQPESATVRNLAALQGKTLAQDINRLVSRVRDLRQDANERVIGAAEDINRLLEEIRALNVRITEVEGGSTSESDAVGLRDQRELALTQLSELIDVRTAEQSSGAINVFSGGDFLVFEGTARQVEVELTTDRGLSIASLQISETESEISVSSGELAGLYAARDEILGGFIDQINEFAGTLAFEFNRVFSSGQGLSGYQSLTSEFAVDDVNAALDAAGLDFTPGNGQFQLQIFNKQTGLTQTTDIRVDLNGLDDDTTLTDLVAAIDAVDGVSASITADRRLSITSDSTNQDFAFAEDTSGILAALGVNTFFSGTSAQDIGVSQTILDDPSKFTASKTGVGQGTDNAVLLAGFLDQPLETQSGATLTEVYDRLTGSVTQGSAVTKSVAEGFRAFEQTLEGEQLAISGVSLDEEAVRLITFQRAFQASARYISTLSDLLDLIVNL